MLVKVVVSFESTVQNKGFFFSSMQSIKKEVHLPKDPMCSILKRSSGIKWNKIINMYVFS